MQIPRQPQPLLSLPGSDWGAVTPGNIDLLNRPMVNNPDGSVSTVRSVSFTMPNGHELLLPTVIGDRVVPAHEALHNFLSTGQHLGIFKNLDAANSYAQALHQQQASLYSPKTVLPPQTMAIAQKALATVSK